MKKSILSFLLLPIILFNGCKENIIQETDPRFFNDAFHGNIIGKVIQKTSGAKVTVNQIDPVQSTMIDPSDGSFRLENLPIGNYDLEIKADNYRIYRRYNVKVEGAGTTYLGEIDLSQIPDLVDSHYPENQAEIVYNNRFRRLTISLLFTQPMDRESVEEAFSTDPPTEGIFYWGQYSYEPNYIYFTDRYNEGGFVPEATISTYSKITSLSYQVAQKDSHVDTTYNVFLSTAAHDTAGNHLRFPLEFSFSTIQSSSTIYGIQTNPFHGDIEVGLISYSGITITFPRNMDQVSTEAAISMSPVMETYFIWPEYNQLTIYTGGVLFANTTYHLKIDSTAQDLDGISLKQPFEFSFSTASVQVQGTSPRNGELFVNYSDLKIQMTFNTYMKKSSIINAFSISPSVSGSYNWYPSNSKTSLAFFPSGYLSPNTKYTVTIANTAEDLFGSQLEKPYTFSFITRPE